MPSNDHTTYISPWIPLSMLAVTTAALALPLALLRRHQGAANSIKPSLLKSTSKLSSSPPVRRRAPPLPRHGSITVPSAIPLSSQGTDGVSAQTIPLVKTGNILRTASGESSLRVSRIKKDGSFNGALYSLKAFGIATALVVAGGAASVWSVKTYLGVKDTQEFASAMRTTTLDKLPLLISRIHRSPMSNSSSQISPDPDPDLQSPPHSRTPSSHSASKSLDGPGCPRTADEDSDGRDIDMNKDEDWNWLAAQARLVAAYERGGIAQFAEVVIRELEAESEFERRKRRIGVPVEGSR